MPTTVLLTSNLHFLIAHLCHLFIGERVRPPVCVAVNDILPRPATSDTHIHDGWARWTPKTPNLGPQNLHTATPDEMGTVYRMGLERRPKT